MAEKAKWNSCQYEEKKKRTTTLAFSMFVECIWMCLYVYEKWEKLKREHTSGYGTLKKIAVFQE